MKKSFLLFAAAIFAFAACYKENPETPEVINNEEEVILTFSSAKPELDDADPTKTAWDASTRSIVWSTGDKIRVGYTLDGEWMGQAAAGDAKFYLSQEVVIDNDNASIGTFNVPVSGSAFTDPAEDGKYMFYAISPGALLSSTTVAEAPYATVTLKASQSPAADSFDPATDIMVGKTAEMSMGGLPTDPIQLVWNRAVAHGNFTLKDLRGVEDGETITKVTLTAQEGAVLAGEVSLSLDDGTYIASNATNVIVLSGANMAFVEENDMTNLKIWLSAFPETFTALTVALETNKATYVREITGISKTLKRNARNVLAINMADAIRTEIVQVEWVKKNLSDITSDDVFVIVGNNGSNYALDSSNGTNSAPAATAVAVSGDKLAASPVDEIQWNLSGNATDGYIFYPNGTTETWLYCTSTNNGVRVGTNDNKEFILDGGYLKNVATSRYIGIYNSADWRCYTNTSGNIANQTFAFFVKTAATPSKPRPTISFGEPTTTVNISATVENAATIDPSGLTITYSSSNEDVATVSDTGVVTGVAAGTATITASFAGNDEYDAASATYQITVVDPNANDGSEAKPYTASEAINVATSLGSNTKDVYVKGIVCTTGSINTTYNSVTYYISDDGSTTTRLQIYSGKYINEADFTDENNLKMGDYVVVNGTLKLFNNTPEIDKNSKITTILRAPTITPDGGSFETDNMTVEISAENGATIFYTLDGTNPTATTGLTYDGAITITETTTVKAIAVKDEMVTGIVSKTYTKREPSSSLTATITFGNNGTKVNAASVTGKDSENNTWIITSEGTTSFTQNTAYSQIGSSSKPATSITFTCTLPEGASISSLSANFGGFNGTAGDVTLKVGTNSVGSGTLNGTNDVTVSSTSTALGNVVTITVTNIAKGVKVYNISVTYN